ncbi:Permease of the drug/metabolite transporter (DMT) superfamily [Halorubrum xinjiangense]|uniref:Permease of the drug/metabolite transporter (DMT) superfamily n=1 Tax=Halorubrum xinjiangense TaxID=261291 RepID=A0A1G7R918_9EURY|nr:DMT family transporter [Halorubrum xinjiangense]SDG07247.1 Permease of the drug/metabolite transporter (DMT) superfamily [Halorubrum xinjiangense]
MNLRNLLSTPEAIVAAFLLLATLWGTSFVAIEAGLHYFPPLLFAGLRYVVAGAVVLAYAAVAADRWLPRGRDEWLGVAVAGTFVIAAYHGFLYLGEMRVSGAVAAVVVSLAPVLTAVFAAVLLPNERLGPVEIGGFALGIVGVVVIADPAAAGLGSAAVVGVALAFAGAVAFSLGAVLLRPLRTDLPIAALQGWAMVFGAGQLLVAAGAVGESPATIVWNQTSIASLAYLTLLSGVVAFLLYFALLDAVGPSQLHLVGYAEPVVAAVGSWILLGHLVDAEALVGFVAILAGFLVLERHEIADYVGIDRLSG